MVNIKQVEGGGTFDLNDCQSRVLLTEKVLLQTASGKWIVFGPPNRYVPIDEEEAAQLMIDFRVEDDKIPESLLPYVDALLEEGER